MRLRNRHFVIGVLLATGLVSGARYVFNKSDPAFTLSSSPPVRQASHTAPPDNSNAAAHNMPANQMQRHHDSAFLRQSDPRGRHTAFAAYRYYEDGDLRAMAELDDVAALEALAARLAYRSPLEAIELDYEAAILGSIDAVLRNVKIYRSLASGRTVTRSGVESTNYDAKVDLIAAYSWGLVAAMRGEPGGAQSNRDLAAHYKLDSESISVACRHAALVYTDLAASRRERGLRPFDNTPPSVTSVDLASVARNCPYWPVEIPRCIRAPDIPAGVSLDAYRCAKGAETA